MEKENKYTEPISIKITKELMNKIDNTAFELGLSRAEYARQKLTIDSSSQNYDEDIDFLKRQSILIQEDIEDMRLEIMKQKVFFEEVLVNLKNVMDYVRNSQYKKDDLSKKSIEENRQASNQIQQSEFQKFKANPENYLGVGDTIVMYKKEGGTIDVEVLECNYSKLKFKVFAKELNKEVEIEINHVLIYEKNIHKIIRKES